MATRLTTIIVVAIVSATFIAGLIVGAQRDDASGPVDLIILNGKVYPGRGAKLQEALAVRGNQILRVGTNREITRLRRPQTVVLDAHGAAVVPGFNDADVRLMDAALALDQVDLGDAVTPEPSRADKIASLRTAINEAHKRGVTSVQTVSRSDEELDLLNEVREQGELALRIYGSVEVSTDVTEKALEVLEAIRGAFPDDPLIKAGGIDLICAEQCEPAKLQHAVALLDKHRWQIRVRAHDADARGAIEALEHAASENPEPPRGRRHWVVDVDNVSTADLPDPLADLEEAIANFSDGQLADESKPVPLAGSPTRQPRWGDLAAVQAAIDASTSDAAYASFDEQRKGTLASGMLADIVVLSKDIFANPSERLKDASVAVTIFDGKIVYQRAELN